MNWQILWRRDREDEVTPMIQSQAPSLLCAHQCSSSATDVTAAASRMSSRDLCNQDQGATGQDCEPRKW